MKLYEHSLIDISTERLLMSLGIKVVQDLPEAPDKLLKKVFKSKDLQRVKDEALLLTSIKDLSYSFVKCLMEVNVCSLDTLAEKDPEKLFKEIKERAFSSIHKKPSLNQILDWVSKAQVLVS